MSKQTKQIQHKVLQLIKESPGLDVDDLAEELNVPVRAVSKAVNKLLRAGKISSQED
jgi:predicted transcriptional regulator